MIFSIDQILQLRKSFNALRNRKKKTSGNSLRRIREEIIGNKELLNRCCNKLGERGIVVYQAKTFDDARNILKKEIRSSCIIVKAKSNVSKELEITGFLEGLGKTVIETDIGDRILQIAGDTPSHPTGPISHLSMNDIRYIMENHFGHQVGNTPEEIVEVIKNDVRSYIDKAEIAIVGANAVTAEEGSILILHNEGNVSEIIQKARKLIVITGIDKVYKNLEQAVQMVKAVTYHATGTEMPSFINIISGPSKTADIEKKLIQGVHNPREIVLILLDGKRSEIINSNFKDILYCIGCGSCLVVCPVYNAVGNRFAYQTNLGGRGLILSYVKDSVYKAAKIARLCITCYQCKRGCPIDIDIPGMIWRIRRLEGLNNIVALFYSRIILAINLIRLKKFQLYKKTVAHIFSKEGKVNTC